MASYTRSHLFTSPLMWEDELVCSKPTRIVYPVALTATPIDTSFDSSVSSAPLNSSIRTDSSDISDFLEPSPEVQPETVQKQFSRSYLQSPCQNMADLPLIPSLDSLNKASSTQTKPPTLAPAPVASVPELTDATAILSRLAEVTVSHVSGNAASPSATTLQLLSEMSTFLQSTVDTCKTLQARIQEEMEKHKVEDRGRDNHVCASDPTDSDSSSPVDSADECADSWESLVTQAPWFPTLDDESNRRPAHVVVTEDNQLKTPRASTTRVALPVHRIIEETRSRQYTSNPVEKASPRIVPETYTHHNGYPIACPKPSPVIPVRQFEALLERPVVPATRPAPTSYFPTWATPQRQRPVFPTTRFDKMELPFWAPNAQYYNKWSNHGRFPDSACASKNRRWEAPSPSALPNPPFPEMTRSPAPALTFPYPITRASPRSPTDSGFSEDRKVFI
ncbi:hypothetical protein BJ165DRAFT_1528194 [Panaeolus papilionaceus]|nr:hypothetical protein BJ165DRAFT_1528194 [Panaeolus papilionaceus]